MCHSTLKRKEGRSQKQWDDMKVCSIACRGKYLSTLPHIAEKVREAQLGESNSNWKGGAHKCKICGKLLKGNYTATYCKKCQPPNNWKGENASMVAIHAWVRRHRGIPQKCEHCGTTDASVYHWANKSHKYYRDLSDWIRLCVPCHSKYDNEYHKSVISRN